LARAFFTLSVGGGGCGVDVDGILAGGGGIRKDSPCHS
jgi:hypothetical protein